VNQIELFVLIAWHSGILRCDGSLRKWGIPQFPCVTRTDDGVSPPFAR
jgi:hypothetical protein